MRKMDNPGSATETARDDVYTRAEIEDILGKLEAAIFEPLKLNHGAGCGRRYFSPVEQRRALRLAILQQILSGDLALQAIMKSASDFGISFTPRDKRIVEMLARGFLSEPKSDLSFSPRTDARSSGP